MAAMMMMAVATLQLGRSRGIGDGRLTASHCPSISTLQLGRSRGIGYGVRIFVDVRPAQGCNWADPVGSVMVDEAVDFIRIYPGCNWADPVGSVMGASRPPPTSCCGCCNWADPVGSVMEAGTRLGVSADTCCNWADPVGSVMGVPCPSQPDHVVLQLGRSRGIGDG